MSLSPGDVRLISKGNRLENAGKHKKAEVVYRRAIQCVGASNPGLSGSLHINLGTNAAAAGRHDDSIRFYLEAVRILDGLKGEAILECAHAHWNIAIEYLDQDDSRALHHAEAAVKLYNRYPFTQPIQKAKGAAILIVARASFAKVVDDRSLREAWTLTRDHPVAELGEETVVNFLLIYLAPLYVERREEYKRTLTELAAWAPAELVQFVASFVETHNQR